MFRLNLFFFSTFNGMSPSKRHSNAKTICSFSFYFLDIFFSDFRLLCLLGTGKIIFPFVELLIFHLKHETKRIVRILAKSRYSFSCLLIIISRSPFMKQFYELLGKFTDFIFIFSFEMMHYKL